MKFIILLFISNILTLNKTESSINKDEEIIKMNLERKKIQNLKENLDQEFEFNEIEIDKIHNENEYKPSSHLNLDHKLSIEEDNFTYYHSDTKLEKETDENYSSNNDAKNDKEFEEILSWNNNYNMYSHYYYHKIERNLTPSQEIINKMNKLLEQEKKFLNSIDNLQNAKFNTTHIICDLDPSIKDLNKATFEELQMLDPTKYEIISKSQLNNKVNNCYDETDEYLSKFLIKPYFITSILAVIIVSISEKQYLLQK